MVHQIWPLIASVRQHNPLVLNLTNQVVMNNTANALLAIGASPIMAHAQAETREILNICQSLVINIGTLDEFSSSAMRNAAKIAQELHKPWVLDPVGAGISNYRNALLAELLPHKPTVIRGNASEIMALAKFSDRTGKGVDATASSTEAIQAGKNLSQLTDAIVCISGQEDIVIYQDREVHILNGHPLMTQVTGLGCSATAVIAAFIGCIPNRFEATVAATTFFSLCGELAQRRSSGPGSLQVQLLDQLYLLSEDEFNAHANLKDVFS